MDESDLHPPNVVQFTSQQVGFGGRRTPDSPLSSAPGSPNSGRFDDLVRSRTGLSDRAIVGGEVFPDEHQHQHLGGYHRREKSSNNEVPFDENGGVDEEKKMEERVMLPEESGMVPMITLSKRNEYDPIIHSRIGTQIDPVGPEDEQQEEEEPGRIQHVEGPNNKATNNVSFPAAAPAVATEEDSSSKPKLQKPSMICRRKTTGDLLASNSLQQVTPSPGRSNRRGASLTLEDADRAKMQQHLNFAALKRDILSNEWSLHSLHKEDNKNTDTPQTRETAPESLATPLPDLSSPPAIRLRANLEDGIAGDLSTSFGSPDGAYPSFYSGNYTAGRNHDSAAIAETDANTSSVVREGTIQQVPLKGDAPGVSDVPASKATKLQPIGPLSEAEGANNVDDMGGRNDVHSSRHSKDSHESRISVSYHIQKAESGSQGTEVAANRSMDQGDDTNESNDDHGHSGDHQPPANAATRSATDAAVTKALNDALSHSAMTQRVLTEAYGLSAEGAAPVVESVVNDIRPSLSSGDDAYLNKFSTLRSDSDLSGAGNTASASDQAQLPSSDWSMYLSDRGIKAASESSRDVSGGNNGSRGKQVGFRSKSEHTYKEMTPKKDIQSSENSAWWLQEELRRRSIIKREINDAIVAKGADNESAAAKEPPAELDSSFALQLARALENMSPRVGDYKTCNSFADDSNEDLEVAAITNDKDGAWVKGDATSREVEPPPGGMSESKEPVFSPPGKPRPRRLNYDEADDKRAASVEPSRYGASEVAGHRRYRSDDGAEQREDNPMFGEHYRPQQSDARGTNASGKDAQVPANVLKLEARVEHEDTNLMLSHENGDAAEQMERFASETRAALRGQTGAQTRDDPRMDNPSGPQPRQYNNEMPMVPHSPFRSIEITHSASSPMPEDPPAQAYPDPVKSAPKEPSGSKKSSPLGVEPNKVSVGPTKRMEKGKVKIQPNITPTLVQSMDSKNGIAKGDITLSLLNENTGRIETAKNATWAGRVHGAVWRCRRMRRCIAGEEAEAKQQAGTPPKGRSSLPVDLDKGRVEGGYRSISSTQDAALLHLKHDEIDEALELFEDIIFAYYAYFEQSLKAREKNPNLQGGLGTTDFKPYIGVALHNLGILNLLNGDYKEALSFFMRAVENRKACLGEGHPDHVTSLVKLAICQYALDDFGGAHAKLGEALNFSRRSAPTIEDRIQIAEILNNLGCLGYMCGNPMEAKAYFKESLDVQFAVMSESLYCGPPHTMHSVSLNISITRANIGFLKLVTKDLPIAITALEAALMEQQLLLRGAHDTLIATMDHLAVANLLNGNQQQASQMFGRILELQKDEYGPHDRRCFVTMEKINMVRRRGTNFENAVDNLRKTFTGPPTLGNEENEEQPETMLLVKSSSDLSENRRNNSELPPRPHSGQSNKGRPPKTNKVLKVFTSMRKKKPSTGPR